MGRATVRTNEQVIANQHFTILELLDRLLDKGVVVKGEVLLSVADIDLVYLNLGLLLSSVKTVEQAARKGGGSLLWRPSTDPVDAPRPESQIQESVPEKRVLTDQSNRGGDETRAAVFLPAVDDNGEPEQFAGPRANIDPNNVEKGLAQLVLTVIELIRKLMEKQAIRRVDAGQLSAADIEKLGNAFFLLDERMGQLKDTFGLQDEDLNLDLGPLGELL